MVLSWHIDASLQPLPVFTLPPTLCVHMSLVFFSYGNTTHSIRGQFYRRKTIFSSVQSLSCILLFATRWTAVHQASLSITNSRSLLKLMSIESVMPSNYLILCHPLLLLLSIFPSIRVFSDESVLCIRWTKYWSFSFSPSNEYSD